jgi:cysteine desulfurase
MSCLPYISSVRTIYFDYNATTPLDPQIREAMSPYLGEVFGNPSSIHHVGQRARAVLDDARHRLARVWSCKPNEVVFTSGGTESTNLAIFGTARQLRHKGRHIITSLIEHHCVLHCFEYLAAKEGFEITYLPVDFEGLVDPEALEQAIRPDTTLVSIMAANNETGTLQQVAQFGQICRNREVVFHTDAVQWFGKETFSAIGQFNADLVSLCAHKYHGPKGAGALFVRSPLSPDPILFGGGHENERRAGTENLAGIIGLVEASERFVRTPVFSKAPLLPLRERLFHLVESIPGAEVRGSRTLCLANTLSFTVADCDSITLLAGLDLEGVCASSGSACSAGSLKPSHVLTAMGLENQLSSSLIRFSLGRDSTLPEVEQVEQILPAIIRRTRGY